MADESQEAVTGTAPESADAVKETVPKAPVASTTAEEQPADAASDKAAEPQPKKVDPRQRKIAEQAYQLREQGRRIDQLIELTHGMQQQMQPGKADPRPKLDAFGSIEEWKDADDEWKDRQREAKQQTKAEPETRQPEDRTRQLYTLPSDYRGARDVLFENGAEKYTDFEEVVTKAGHITGPMAVATLDIDDSDMQAEVMYYLAKNQKEAARIASLPVLRQAAEIGRLEAKLSSAPIRQPSKAPAPINPVNGSSTQNDEIQPEMAYEKFLKIRNKQLGR